MTKKPVKKTTAKKTSPKKSAPKKKNNKEEVLEVETFKINQALAFSRVAIYLEEAGEIAVNTRSIEGMLTVAKGWMELADLMEPGHETPKRARIGFAGEEE
jgi:hypothetical protein